MKQSETPAKACAAKALKGRRNTGRGKTPEKCCQHTSSPQACYNEACAPVLASLQSWGFTPARIPSPLRGCDAHPCAGVSPLPVFCHPFGVSAVEPYQARCVERVVPCRGGVGGGVSNLDSGITHAKTRRTNFFTELCCE